MTALAKQCAGRAAELRRPVGLLVAISLCLSVFGLESCGPSAARTQNPPTLWVGFGQTELELILRDSEPPYY